MKVAYLIEPPFNYRDESGAITGCDVELARQVLHQLGIGDVIFVEVEFADLLPGLTRKAWQMTTGLFATETRQALALFSRPIWALPDGLLIRSADTNRFNGYRSLAGLDALKLAVIRDQFQHQNALDMGVPPDRILVFATYLEAADAVRAGQVDAYASVARAHEGYLERTPNAHMTSIVIPSSEKPAAFGCFGFDKANPDLRDAVDGVLNTLIGSKAHRQLMKTFGFSDDDIDLLV
ncbi:transporter substrate-binding domain-containing protein [Aestuariibius sp. 2305UL40-4]|uniref:transporter substrate-binding domain-containing protein n=1 Tax=Aestuariibius violaceus TaxID=3234132 RepID=UPI00345EC017